MLNRFNTTPRENSIQQLEYVGMYYHTINGKQYWNESACYTLTTNLVDKVEQATNDLHSMCMDYVADTVKSGNYDDNYEFDEFTKQLIEISYKENHPHIYGRFDLGIDVNNNIKMLEYNADTPTSLLEASVVQWNYKEQVFPQWDQFNSIHEKLIERWKYLNIKDKIYFSSLKNGPMEDWGNVHYLLETAVEAGIKTASIDIEEIGWDSVTNQFVDVYDQPISIVFKLYPWEWFRKDKFYQNVLSSLTLFIEPPWKMLLSNKLLAVKLWERYPSHPLLLESYVDNGRYSTNRVVVKPMLGREGQGIYKTYGMDTKGEKGTIVQDEMDIIKFGEIQPVIGSWVIGDESAGIGIREDIGITTNNSQFVPHIFR